MSGFNIEDFNQIITDIYKCYAISIILDWAVENFSFLCIEAQTHFVEFVNQNLYHKDSFIE